MLLALVTVIMVVGSGHTDAYFELGGSCYLLCFACGSGMLLDFCLLLAVCGFFNKANTMTCCCRRVAERCAKTPGSDRRG